MEVNSNSWTNDFKKSITQKTFLFGFDFLKREIDKILGILKRVNEIIVMKKDLSFSEMLHSFFYKILNLKKTIEENLNNKVSYVLDYFFDVFFENDFYYNNIYCFSINLNVN